MLIEDFVNQSLAIDDLDELFSLYKNAMLRIGFDRLSFGLVTDHLDIEEHARLGIMANYPDDWIKHYTECQYAEIDPVVWGIKNYQRAFTWDDCWPKGSGPHQKLKDQSRDAGLFDGIGIPLHGRGGSIAGVGAASSTMGVNLNAVKLALAHLISQHFYTCYISLAEKKKSAPKFILNNKEIEILKWSSEGYTKLQISEKLNLSIHTIDYHVRNILRKFDVPNMTAAVFSAVRQRYLTF